MKKLLLPLLMSLSLVTGAFASGDTPAAASEAVVTVGDDVRFTVLTPGIIRMEWDSTGRFTDEASFVVVNRNLPVPEFKVRRSGKWITITTSQVTLRYQAGSGRFTPDNLTVSSVKGSAVPFVWHYGDTQKENLKGTYRTLDGYDGDYQRYSKKTMPIEDGLLARDGWSVIDDSGSFLFDDTPWPWVKTRANGGAQDLYFMAYGHDYKGALRDFTRIAGRVPLPPRYTFGYWWSRYWAYSDTELRELVNNFERFDVPLDVLVIDMDWHRTDVRGKDEFGQRRFWTGWTWDRNLFPSPEKFIGWTNDKGLKTTLNLHPASGLAPFEEKYAEMAAKMDFDTTGGRNIPWIASDKKFMTNFFETVLYPMQRMGIDFWWLDWQQWLTDPKVKGLSNTWWLNYIFFTEREHNGDLRPMLYHRWGGLGNHRYQIGFSGDSYITWKSLEFQPYFTNCASNVLYGYWSHDIGGHQFANGEKSLDPELYTRWLQYGVFSPVLRTHSTKNAALNKEIWNFRGDYFNAQHQAIRLRYTLVPYIYTTARQCYETGISLCRPMYYDYPEAPEAYALRNQFMFGDDMLVAPIGSPMVDGFSKVTAWLPEGNDWYEWSTGTLLKGGQSVERRFTLLEYPVYIKAGAVIPMYDRTVKNLDSNPSKIIVSVFPGADGEGTLYEDGGNDPDYASRYATTRFTSRISADGSRTITIGAREGEYKDMAATRTYELRLCGSDMPASVKVDGKEVAFGYDGASLSVVIDLGEHSCAEARTVEVKYPAERIEVNDGMKGQMNRLNKTTVELKFRSAHIELPAEMASAAEASVQLDYFPERFASIVAKYRHDVSRIPAVLATLELSDTDKAWFLDRIYIK